MQIINQVGPPVAGNDFYGRILELKRAHQLLDTGHSLVLSAPRRIGKSSFAKRLIDDKTTQGWKCAYIDLEGVHTRDEFLTTLAQSLDHDKDTLVVIDELTLFLGILAATILRRGRLNLC